MFAFFRSISLASNSSSSFSFHFNKVQVTSLNEGQIFKRGWDNVRITTFWVTCILATTPGAELLVEWLFLTGSARQTIQRPPTLRTIFGACCASSRSIMLKLQRISQWRSLQSHSKKIVNKNSFLILSSRREKVMCTLWRTWWKKYLWAENRSLQSYNFARRRTGVQRASDQVCVETTCKSLQTDWNLW